jgi:hypothetical protein
MQAYGFIVNLTAEEEGSVRERLDAFLASKAGSAHDLACSVCNS